MLSTFSCVGRKAEERTTADVPHLTGLASSEGKFGVWNQLLHSNRIRRKEARVEIRSWAQWAHEKAGQRSWSQQRNSLGLVVSEKEPRTQRRASLQESK